MEILKIVFGIAQVGAAILLIYLVAIQQSKNEGLGAAISARPTTSFKGKAGFDERLTDLTKKFSIAFFGLSIIVALLMRK